MFKNLVEISSKIPQGTYHITKVGQKELIYIIYNRDQTGGLILLQENRLKLILENIKMMDMLHHIVNICIVVIFKHL